MKTSVIGAGLVGAAAAYAMTLRGSASEIVLVDKNEKRAIAEASDISHAVPVSSGVNIVAGDYTDIKGSGVVILSAGVNQSPGETRLQLLERNARIFEDIVPRVVQEAPEAVLLVATNPVDILTSLTEKIAGLPPGRVMGSGTTLDTARFRSLVAGKVDVDPRHVHGYVVGEHGDSEVLAWSTARVAGLHIEDFCRSRRISWTEKDRSEIDERVRKAAYKIIEGKGATYFGIGAVLARITEAILRGEKSVMTVSASTPYYGVAMSLPRIVGREGILDLIGVSLDEGESQRLEKSATILREALDTLIS